MTRPDRGSFTDQSGFAVRCEWGPPGVQSLAGCRTFIVIDVLSFTTCVSVAAAAGAVVFPAPARDAAAAELAAREGAVLAAARGAGYSLSPESLVGAPAGLRLVLPSPNGATVSLAAEGPGRVLAGCLRNRSAVAARAAALGGPFALIPAGERWPDGSLRPALEDWMGAGAIAALLPGNRSPEAAAAVAIFEASAPALLSALRACASGRELIERGFPADVDVAAALDRDAVAPELREGCYGADSAGGG
jgi:2-phosphosulfolactate phosphatase